MPGMSRAVTATVDIHIFGENVRILTALALTPRSRGLIHVSGRMIFRKAQLQNGTAITPMLQLLLGRGYFHAVEQAVRSLYILLYSPSYLFQCNDSRSSNSLRKCFFGTKMIVLFCNDTIILSSQVRSLHKQMYTLDIFGVSFCPTLFQSITNNPIRLVNESLGLCKYIGKDFMSQNKGAPCT